MKMDTRWLRNSFVYLVIMVAVLAVRPQGILGRPA